MDLIEKNNHALENIEKNLQDLQNDLIPFIKQMEYIKRTIGTPQTKSEREIGNLLFSGDSPVIWYKQCHSQINTRLQGTIDSFYQLQKLKNIIEKLQEKDHLSQKEILKLSKAKLDYVSLEGYIQNSIIEIKHYTHTAESIKSKHNIPDNITQADIDNASIEDHIKTAFKQAVQDMTQLGTISSGTFGHLEQWGIHPMTARFYVYQYIESCEQLLKEQKTPQVNHLYEFLHQMYLLHKDCYKDNMHRLGVS